MKQHTLLLLGTLLAIASMTACKSSQQSTTTLPTWLQEITTSLNDTPSDVILYDYNGALYYAVSVQGPKHSYDMGRTTVYDSEGNTYFVTGGNKKKEEKELTFYEHAINKGTLWQSKKAR